MEAEVEASAWKQKWWPVHGSISDSDDHYEWPIHHSTSLPAYHAGRQPINQPGYLAAQGCR